MAFREMLNVSDRSEKVADLGVVPRVTMTSAPRKEGVGPDPMAPRAMPQMPSAAR